MMLGLATQLRWSTLRNVGSSSADVMRRTRSLLESYVHRAVVTNAARGDVAPATVLCALQSIACSPGPLDAITVRGGAGSAGASGVDGSAGSSGTAGAAGSEARRETAEPLEPAGRRGAQGAPAPEEWPALTGRHHRDVHLVRTGLDLPVRDECAGQLRVQRTRPAEAVVTKRQSLSRDAAHAPGSNSSSALVG
jgi:hypothetical protein